MSAKKDDTKAPYFYTPKKVDLETLKRIAASGKNLTTATSQAAKNILSFALTALAPKGKPDGIKRNKHQKKPIYNPTGIDILKQLPSLKAFWIKENTRLAQLKKDRAAARAKKSGKTKGKA